MMFRFFLRVYLGLYDIASDFKSFFCNIILPIKENIGIKMIDLPTILFVSVAGFVYIVYSRETQDNIFIKNFLFVTSERKQIPQKLETLKLQLLDDWCDSVTEFDRKQYRYNKKRKKFFTFTVRKKKKAIVNVYNIFRYIIDNPRFKRINRKISLKEFNEEKHQLSDNYKKWFMEIFKSIYFSNLTTDYNDSQHFFLMNEKINVHTDFFNKFKQTEFDFLGFLEINPDIWWKFFFHKTYGPAFRECYKDHFEKIFFQTKKTNDQIPLKLESAYIDVDQKKKIGSYKNYEDYTLKYIFEYLDEVYAYVHYARHRGNVFFRLKEFFFTVRKPKINFSFNNNPKNLRLFLNLTDFLSERKEIRGQFLEKAEELFEINKLVYQQNNLIMRLMRLRQNDIKYEYKRYKYKSRRRKKYVYIRVPNNNKYLKFWNCPKNFKFVSNNNSNNLGYSDWQSYLKKNKKVSNFSDTRKMSGYLFADFSIDDISKIQRIFDIEKSKVLQITNKSFLKQQNYLDWLESLFDVENKGEKEIKNFKYKNTRNSAKPYIYKQLIQNFDKSSRFVIFSISFIGFFIHFVKDLYKSYGKEMVESCLDTLKYIGFIYDIDRAKEKLKMRNYDVDYRTIYADKEIEELKIRNIIGLDDIIKRSYNMILFLKKKRVKASVFLDFGYGYFFIEPFFTLFFNNFSNIRKRIQYKSFLFVGPPGTGKTLFARTIVAETRMPIVIQSGSILKNSRKGQGIQTVRKLFEKAREIFPCVLFFDEIDTFSSTSRNEDYIKSKNIWGELDIMNFSKNIEDSDFLNPPEYIKFDIKRNSEFYNDNSRYWEEPEFIQTIVHERIPIEVLRENQKARSYSKEQLNILTQLLIELDNVKTSEDIIVFSSTNQLNKLDKSLLRAGRFKQILLFPLPNYNARIKLLKFYTNVSDIGTKDVNWDYFSKLTFGLTPSDIASIAFTSELIAIQNDSPHTLKTLNKGIDLVKTAPLEFVIFYYKKLLSITKSKLYIIFNKNISYYSIYQFFTSYFPVLFLEYKKSRIYKYRKKFNYKFYKFKIKIASALHNSYYNVGKILWFFCLPKLELNFPSPLWERPLNFRFSFEKLDEFSEFDRKLISRCDLELKFSSFFGGKAAESIFIFSSLNKRIRPIETFKNLNNLKVICIDNYIDQSNLNLQKDFKIAQKLLRLMVEKWHLYVEIVCLEQFHPILDNFNKWEYETDLSSEIERLFNYSIFQEKTIEMDMRHQLSSNTQKRSFGLWFLKRTLMVLNFPYTKEVKWFRIYLSNIENSKFNVEWIDSDIYYHVMEHTRACHMTWTEFMEKIRFGFSNYLIIQNFDKSFSTLRQFSEFIDFLSDGLLRRDILYIEDFLFKIKIFYDEII